MGEQEVVDAARAYVAGLNASDVVTGASVVSGPVRFDTGAQAWLVDVRTIGTRLLVSVLAEADGRAQFGHLWVTL
jgi:hypothetical protein